MIIFNRYGFDKQRCVEALHLLDGDIGSSFEYLYSKCFDLPVPMDIGTDEEEDNDENGSFSNELIQSKEEKLRERGVTWEEVEEQREEEILALESIYIDEFEVRIPNRIWMFRLELKNLVDLVMDSTKGLNVHAEALAEENSDICKFYKKGSCHFGDRCRYKHSLEDSSVKKNTEEKEDKANFELELRFGKDNIYPYEPPIIGFSALVPGFPSHVCLNITDNMLKEARELASNQSPASFSLIALLEDDLMAAQWIEKHPLPFSLPESESSIISSSRSSKRQGDGNFQQCAKYHVAESMNDKYTKITDEKEAEVLMKMVEAEENIKQRKEDGKSEADEVEDKPVSVKRTNFRESDQGNKVSQGEILKQNRRLKDEYHRKLVPYGYASI